MITFKKGKMRLPETYSVRRDKVKIATIQKFANEDAWFWYGAGRNTAARPASLEECKAQVKKFFQKETT